MKSERKRNDIKKVGKKKMKGVANGGTQDTSTAMPNP